jgi:hypothetical protein
MSKSGNLRGSKLGLQHVLYLTPLSSECMSAQSLRLRGVVHIEAEKRSKFIEIIKNYYALAIREIGF